MAWTDVSDGDKVDADHINDIHQALNGTVGKAQPMAFTEVDEVATYALDVRNKDATNSLIARFRNAANEVVLSIVKEAVNTAKQIVSTVADGTAPFVVNSTTKVDNLHVARATLADTLEGQQVNDIVPIGAILLWSGSIVSIPDKWALCDGNNGTPNLQDKFVMGAGTTAVGVTGGANTVNLQHGHTQGNTGSESSHTHTQGNTGSESSHTHSAGGSTSSAGSHSHTAPTSLTETSSDHSYGVGGLEGLDSSGGKPHTHDIGVDALTTSTVGNHSHSIPTTAAGSAHSHSNPTTSAGSAHKHTNPTTANALSSAQDNRPAFYALAYIMRVQ